MIASLASWFSSGTPPRWEQALGVVLILFFEKWLPNSKYKANSTLEMIGNAIKPFLDKFPIPGVYQGVKWLATPEPVTSPLQQPESK